MRFLALINPVVVALVDFFYPLEARLLAHAAKHTRVPFFAVHQPLEVLKNSRLGLAVLRPIFPVHDLCLIKHPADDHLLGKKCSLLSLEMAIPVVLKCVSYLVRF